MYAVIKTGGKQYKVAEGDLLVVEKLSGAEGDKLSFDEVLMLGGDAGVTLGSPRVEGASVAAEVVEQGRGEKIIVFKKNRRKHYRRRNGHRQLQTTVRITDILTGAKPAKKAKAAKKAEPKAAAEATEAAAPSEEKSEE
jgi:large subunit ribosomal protein L21